MTYHSISPVPNMIQHVPLSGDSVVTGARLIEAIAIVVEASRRNNKFAMSTVHRDGQEMWVAGQMGYIPERSWVVLVGDGFDPIQRDDTTYKHFYIVSCSWSSEKITNTPSHSVDIDAAADFFIDRLLEELGVEASK